ncbi:MAG: hypothetical protein EZS28_053154, partial [Streblomastix strix]
YTMIPAEKPDIIILLDDAAAPKSTHDRQRSDGADTISQSTKHQKIEPLTSAVSASYGLGVACFWSIIKSIFFISIGKNHVGYYYIAKVINTLFILEKDIIVYIYVPDIGQLVDCVLSTQVGK